MVPDAAKQMLVTLSEKHFDKVLRYIEFNVKQQLPVMPQNLVQQFCRLMMSMVLRMLNVHDTLKAVEEDAISKLKFPGPGGEEGGEEALLKDFDCLFWWSCIWSFGATGGVPERAQMDEYFKGIITEMAVPFPDKDAPIYDWIFSEPMNEEDGKAWSWVLWVDTLDTSPIPENKKFNEIIVPTKDSGQFYFIAELLMRNKYPALFVGTTGTGKSVYTNDVLRHYLPKDKYLPLNIFFSAQTSQNMVQNQIDLKLDKRRKGRMNIPGE